MSAEVRVLVVDDSATARALLREVCAAAPRISVVGEAVNGREAVEKVTALRPSLVVMDIQMPVMDGIEATRRIMTEIPTPILVVTSHYDRDVAMSLRAVQAGALSVAAKPVGPGSPRFREDAQRLLRLVTALAGVTPVRRSRTGPASATDAPPSGGSAPTSTQVSVVGVAASTGGPAAVYRLLELLPAHFGAPVLLVQHMADGFTPGLTKWLSGATSLHVKLAEHGELLVRGSVYVAPDRCHLRVTGNRRVELSDSPAVAGFRPSASVLFTSMAESYGRRAAAVVLTGMGSDGLDGARALRKADAFVLAQDAESSAVFGMPRAVAEAGLANAVGTVEQLAYRVSRMAPSKP